MRSEFDGQAKEKAESIITTWKDFIEQNKDKITALQIIFNEPYGKRHFTFNMIKQLAGAIEKPPYNLKPELVWLAYERLDKSKVKGAPSVKLLTNIISLLRFTVGETDLLIPFIETVEQRFAGWIAEQETKGKKFNTEQIEWLEMIKNFIATSLEVTTDDFEYTPFAQKGGLTKVYNLFGDELNSILDELNSRLVA